MTERLLNDDEVGWHSGDWEMNMRSVAICFDGDLSQTPPTATALRACARLITNYKYKKNRAITEVIGHNDVAATECPGNWSRYGGLEQLLAAATK